jgi:MFS family permease
VLLLVILAVFSSLGLGRFGYSMVLPAMQKGLAITNTQTGELQSWNLVGYMVTVVGAGALASRFGPRIVISIALFIVAGAMVATGVFPTFTAACLGRFLTGVGGAGANVPAMGLLSAWFGVRMRGLASGIGVAGSSVGLIVTGPLVPMILERYGAHGWRVSWIVFGAMAMAVCLLCAILLRNRPDQMGLTRIGEAEGVHRKIAQGQSASSLQWGLVYKSRYLWQLAGVYFAFGFSYIIFSTFFVTYLVRELGMDSAAAGSLWLKVGLVSTASGFIWGTLSDRWGRRLALAGIFSLQGLCFLLVGFGHGPGAAYLSAGLFALTAWSIPAVMVALCGDAFGAQLAPAALGLITIVFGVGQALGPYVAGWMADVTHSFSSPFALSGIVALLLGAGGALLLPRVTLRG